MLKKYKKLANIIFKNNTKDFNIRKTIEELQELSLILTQQLNKPHKDFSEEIIKEIADVKIRLLYLNTIYNRAAIYNRMIFKIKKIIRNVNNRG